MDQNGSSPSYKDIAAQFAEARAAKVKSDATSRSSSKRAGATSTNKVEEVRFKTSHGLLVVFLTWIFIIHVLGLYFFTKGFLLTKLVLDFKSECKSSPVEIRGPRSLGTPYEGCWHPKSFDKAVIILVDALRYDFTIPFTNSPDFPAPRHFHNSFPILYETAKEQPQNAFLLPFIADPPTATLQRLKGLTTGTLPTFVDAGSSFAGTAIGEDNIIGQLRDANKTLVHLGDDTWQALFPGQFDVELTHAYDSFNVWDLHTVDEGVTEHLFPLLNPLNSSKWDVIVGHYLGVDHAGHRYGPDHPAMTAKLQQMDATIRRMIDSVDDSTLLVVMGDHGMDAKGDHGGESDDEVEAALWMYSRRGSFGRTSHESLLPPQTAKERPVGQIDLVPTLSLLLGVPVPFNNLGAPISEAFIGKGGSDWENLATVHELTAAQIKRYQHEYSNARGLDESTVSKPVALWNAAQKAWTEAVKAAKKPSSESWREAFESLSRYQEENLRICRALWARFDIPSMLQGILILAWALTLLIGYARSTKDLDIAELSPLLIVRAAIGAGVGAAIGLGVSYLDTEWTLLNCSLFGAAIGSLFAVSSVSYYIRRRLALPLPNSLWGGLALLLTVSQSAGFASNSYTIWEDEILLFFISTFGILALISSARHENPVDRTLGIYHSTIFIVLGRVASLSRLCREEQMPYCRSTYYASANSSTSAFWQLLIPYFLAIALPSVIKSYYQGTRSYEGSAGLWIGVALRLGLLLTAIFWTLDAADDGDWFDLPEGALKTVRTVISQLVFGIALAAGTTTFAWAKPCISIGMESKEAPAGKNEARTVVSGQVVTILGYANAHGSRYFLLLCNGLLAVILLQKPMGGGAIAIMGWQILSLLEIVDSNNLSMTAIGPVVLGLLGNFHFFKTGHQAALSSIQWESAFIPLHTIRYPWSPMLVLGNTFGAQILAALAVPLLVLWKQPPKKKGLLGDVAKAASTLMLFHTTIALATTLWAYWLRRHLMLYRIFSPRFMTGVIVLLVVDLVVAFMAVGGVRWNTLAVADVFGY
ncbi:MAG: mannose-ethanolamine phosphotransferase gpi13 [Vezdaea acicularis]|nr:MAG: mannose-ethanolamine phosphotransferase gpi13 [Vezdaea acicularis]